MKDCLWLKPELVGQFEFLEWTPENHLRQTRFVALREDKAQTTCGESSRGFAYDPIRGLEYVFGIRPRVNRCSRILSSAEFGFGSSSSGYQPYTPMENEYRGQVRGHNGV